MKHYSTIRPARKQYTSLDVAKAFGKLAALFAVFVLLFCGDSIINFILSLIFKF